MTAENRNAETGADANSGPKSGAKKGGAKNRDPKQTVDDAIRIKAIQTEAKRVAELDGIELDLACEAAAKDLDIKAAVFMKEVRRIKAKSKAAAGKAAQSVDIEALRVQAGDLIDCKDILSRFGSAVEKTGLINETRNAKILYLVQTSRLLEKVVSTVVKGVSSGGKSYSVERVKKFFPPETYWERTALTDKSLPYSDEDFSHRHLILYEATAIQSTMQQGGSNSTGWLEYFLRTLISEGCIKYESVEKGLDGKMQTVLIEKAGPTGLIITTTGHLHPENENRMLSLTVKDDEAQTKAVMEQIAREVAEGGRQEYDYTQWHALQNYLATGERRVVIPFGPVIATLTRALTVRMRRDFTMLMSLIGAHGLLHQEHRLRDGAGRIVAQIEDYATVYELVADQFSASSGSSVPKIVRETVEAVRLLVTEANGMPVSQTEIATRIKRDKNSTSHRVRAAMRLGYLDNLQEKSGRAARIVLGDQMPSDVEALPSPERVLECWSDLERGTKNANFDHDGAHDYHHGTRDGGENHVFGTPPEITPTLQRSGDLSTGSSSYTVGVSVGGNKVRSNIPTVEVSSYPTTVGALGSTGDNPTVTPMVALSNDTASFVSGHNTTASSAATANQPLQFAPRFREAGPVPAGTPCLKCGIADETVFRLADSRTAGGKSEPLHFACAEAWFDHTNIAAPIGPAPSVFRCDDPTAADASRADDQHRCEHCGETDGAVVPHCVELAADGTTLAIDAADGDHGTMLHRVCSVTWLRDECRRRGLRPPDWRVTAAAKIKAAQRKAASVPLPERIRLCSDPQHRRCIECLLDGGDFNARTVLVDPFKGQTIFVHIACDKSDT
jgi:hypothetical protein